MDSFYGGRQGKPFIIVKNFATCQAMEEAFSKGTEYTEVNYGEYVLINTEDSRNIENGRLYRRGLRGPELIGTIVGPEGFPPHLTLDNYNEVKNVLLEGGHSHLFKEGEYLPSQEEEGNLVSGETHNSIKWRINSVRILTKRNKDNNIIIVNADGSFSHLEDDSGNIIEVVTEEDKIEITSAYETTIYLGFQIPYHFFESEASSISPYDNRIENEDGTFNGVQYNKLVNHETIDLNGEKNPFHHKFTFKIPHGIKGDSFKNIRPVISGENIIFPDEIIYQEGQKILVGDLYNYDNSEEGEFQETYFLSFLKDLNSITLSEDGIITVIYSSFEEESIKQPLTWITGATLEDYNLKISLNRQVAWAKDKDGNEVEAKETYLGNVRNDVGVYIGKTLTDSDLVTLGTSEQESYLNDNYPDGFVNGFYGRLIAIGGDEENKRLYAYSVKNNNEEASWHYIGTVFSGGIEVISFEVETPNLIAGQVAFVDYGAPSRKLLNLDTKTTTLIEEGNNE